VITATYTSHLDIYFLGSCFLIITSSNLGDNSHIAFQKEFWVKNVYFVEAFDTFIICFPFINNHWELLFHSGSKFTWMLELSFQQKSFILLCESTTDPEGGIALWILLVLFYIFLVSN